MGSLISVNVGLPRNVEWNGKMVYTAIWKAPVSGRLNARHLNLDGDGQGDLAGHGGEHRAVMVYQLDSYRYWETYLDRSDFSYGQFGENFTVEGLPDDEVCIGDRYRIGGALFEVTQPRVTCYRVGIRMNNPQMPALLVSHKRPGFYLRVIEEGEVGPGDEIVRVSEGPEHITVAEIDGLLYLPGHPRERLERALLVPALSAGWKGSLRALVEAEDTGNQTGNIGLTGFEAPPPAWAGFRPLRIAEVQRESVDVLSFTFESPDRTPLPAALPGQFLVLKLQPDPASAQVLRNYSISGPPGANAYRISVKRESRGLGSMYLHDHARAGDTLEVSAPRGNFTLAQANDPVVLLSAGIGATPVLAMLHALVIASTGSARDVWWFYGARDSTEHPFAAEVRELLGRLPHSHSFIAYSKPRPDDRPGEHYDAEGRLKFDIMEQLGVAKQSDFYLCGPSMFLDDFVAKLKDWGVLASRIHSEVFGPGASMTPGIASTAQKTPHQPSGEAGAGPLVSFTRSGLAVQWDSRFESLLELAEACDVPVKWSCRTGVCHTCECALIGGDVQYDPEPLYRPADGNTLICCSKPLTGIELDL
jgi:ferredoxin-NADP reductase/MOSC domain-containing protein YiiM